MPNDYVFPDFCKPDFAGTVGLYQYITFDVRSANVAGTIRNNREITLKPADLDIAGRVLDFNQSGNISDLDITRAVLEPEGGDIINLDIAAAVPQLKGQAIRHFKLQVHISVLAAP